MANIEIDLDACTGCKLCFQVCFVDVIRWDHTADVPVVAYIEDCVQCNTCELICPSKSIKVTRDFNVHWPTVA